MQEESEQPQTEHHIGTAAALIREVAEALDRGESERVREMVLTEHPADLAEFINLLDSDRRKEVLSLIGEDLEPEVLVDLDPFVRDEIVGYLGAQESAAKIAELDSDEAVSIIEDLEEDDKQEILSAIPAEYRLELEERLSFPESSAGRLMRKKVVVIPEFWNVGDTIDYLRRVSNYLPEDFYEIFVIDPRHRPIGGMALSRLLKSERAVQVRDIMNPEIYAIRTDMDQEEAAYLFRKYALIETPVVNSEGRMVGVLAVDDMVEVMAEEQEEDLMHLGGVSETDMHSTLFDTVKHRFPWLFINLITAFCVTRVIGLFEQSISQFVMLAVLMPIVASIGGNSGTQALTVAVRALATRELQSANALRVVGKEMLVGLMNGLLLASVMAAAIVLWLHNWKLAAVFAAALILNLLLSGLVGTLIPLTFHRMKTDPAVASGIFLTACTDMAGFFLFLSLASVFLL